LKDIGYYVSDVKMTPELEQLLGVVPRQNEKCSSYEVQDKSNIIMVGECFIKYTKSNFIFVFKYFIGEEYSYIGTEDINKYIKQSTEFLNGIAQQIQTVFLREYHFFNRKIMMLP